MVRTPALALHLHLGRRRLAPSHPLLLDRQWRGLVQSLRGAGPLAACLLPEGVELVLLAGLPAARALARRLARVLPDLVQVDDASAGLVVTDPTPLAGPDALRGAVRAVEGRAQAVGLAEGPLSWRWSTAWDRAGLRLLPGAGAADLRGLLPLGGTIARPAPLPGRRHPGEALPLLAEVAALSCGLHPQELRASGPRASHADGTLRAWRLALALAVDRGWAPQVAADHFGLPAGEPLPGGPALDAARRLLAAVIAGRVCLPGGRRVADLALGRRAHPTAGAPGARLARRLALPR